jgi:hypothetical protein
MLMGDNSIAILVLHDGVLGRSYGDREALSAASITGQIGLCGESFGYFRASKHLMYLSTIYM